MNDPVISYSREIEEFMKENPRLFQVILDAMPVGVQVLKAVRDERNEIIDFKYSFINKSAKAYTQAGKNFLDQGGNKEMEFQQLVEVVETGSPLQVDERLDMDGDINWFGAKYVKFGDGVLITRENIPGLSSRNGNSGLSSELNSLAAKIANVGNWQWDTETGEIAWSENTFRLLGYQPFSFQPSFEKFLDSVHPDDRQRIIEASEKVKMDSETVRGIYEYRIITQDTATTRYIRSISEPYHPNGKKLMIGTLIDITEEVNLIETIAEQNRLLQEDLVMQRKASSALANFKNIIEASNDPIITIDLLGKINYWSPVAVSVYGYNDEEVIGKTLWETIVPTTRKKELETAIVKVQKEGQSIRSMAMQSKRKDGQLLDSLFTIFPLKDEFGKITGGCTMIRDRTEQIKNAEKIKEDALFIGQVADTTPDIIYILDLNTYQVIYTNRQVAEDLHYTPQEISMMKNPILDLIHPDDLNKMLGHLEIVKKTENNKIVEIEYRLQTKNGEYEWYCDRSAVFKRNSHGIAVEKIGISQRISDRKVKEQQLHTILDILNHAEFLSKMGSWEYDIITGDFKWSKGMYHLFSLPAGTSVTPEIYLDYAVKEEKPVACKIVNCIKHDFTPFEEIMTVLPAEQEKKILKIKGVLIKDKKKNPVRMIGVDLDITEQVRATNKIRDLNKELSVKNEDLQSLNNELKIFNNITANDYKETLQTLYTNLEFIASKEARNLSDAAKANIRRAQSAIQKMKLLTSDINMYLELYENPVILSPVDPNEILQTVLSKEQRKIEQYSAEIEVTHFPILPSHPVLLSQLFSNLIDNAIKFRKVVMSPVIKIKYSQADEMNSIPVAVKNMPYGIISVSDNGIGFNEEEAERIFDLFYRASDNVKYKGSGIGLSICKKIMSLHGGFITAEGTRAHGATINCYFPLQKI